MDNERKGKSQITTEWHEVFKTCNSIQKNGQEKTDDRVFFSIFHLYVESVRLPQTIRKDKRWTYQFRTNVDVTCRYTSSMKKPEEIIKFNTVAHNTCVCVCVW